MHKLPYKTWFLAGLWLLLPLVANAAGLGKLTILSALGQTLSAEIDLVSVQKDEASSLAIRLAPPESFTKANIAFSPVLIGARLSIEKRADGTPYVKIVSSRVVNEPFINVLVELSWSRGRLVREYTALIDPPNVPPAPIAAAPVAPPVVAAPVAAVEAPAAAIAPVAESKPVVKPAPTTDAAKPVPGPSAAKPANREYGPVKRGETLARIAANVKPDGVTLEQMLVGIYRNNPDAFAGNMNRLKSGQILRVPDAEQVAATPPADALKEVRVQAANWNAYRQKIADSAGDTPARESSSVAKGKIAPVEDKAASKEAPKEVVKLSKGEIAPGSAKAGKGASTKERMRALEDEATVREKALADANDRIAQLEKNIKDMQRLLELKGVVPAKPDAAKAAAPAAAAPPKAEPAKDAPKAEPAKDMAKAEPAKDAAKAEPAKDAVPAEPAKVAEAPKAEPPPAPKPKPKPKPVIPPPPPPEPDLLDQLTDPLYLGGAGALAVLGIGGYLFVRRRRARADADDGDEQPAKSSAAAAAAAVAPMAVAPVMAPAGVDDVDPLAEADLYLNFGRDTQAEEVLKDALAKNPNHEEAKLKLLQIYAGRKDKDAFEKIAKNLHEQTGGAGDNWIKAAGMGYAIDPDNALYEAGKSAPVADLPAAGAAAGTDLDFDLELAPDGSATGTRTDFDVDSGKTVMMQPGELAGLAAGFDPSATQDVTADSGVGRPLAEEGAAAAPDFNLNIPAGGALATAEPDLTLDAPGPDEMTQTNVNLDAGAGGNMIDFNFDSTAMTAPTPEASAAPELPAFAPNETVVMTPENQENAAGLNIDFEMGKTGKVEDAGLVLPDLNLELPSDLTTSAAPAAEPLLPELRLDDISLNFDEPPKVDAAPAPAAAEGGVKDDRWYDVQTKFDLAKAYQEMGDKDGAREILQEVIKEGDTAQQSEAKALLDSLA